MVTELNVLANISIFSQMKAEDLQRIYHLAKHHHLQKGDIIIREGETDRRLFVILSGEVDVIKDLGGKHERHVRTLGPQSYFGEMALIDEMVRSASVVAKEDVHVLSIDQIDLSKEIERYPAIALELLRMLSQRIRAIEKTMINTLGSFLSICSNCKKIHEKNGSWTTIEKYIADHSETEFSHGLCPDCAEKLYPGYAKKK